MSGKGLPPVVSAAISPNHERPKGPFLNACNGDMESVAPKYGCKPFACAIQDCLERHTYNQHVCSQAINNLIQCCADLEKPHGSIHCEGFLGKINKVREQRQLQQQEQQRQQGSLEGKQTNGGS